MKKHFPTILATLISAAIYSAPVHADLAQQCMVGVPTFDRPLAKGDVNQLPVLIESERSTVNYPSGASFNGNVLLQQGNRRLIAKQVDLTQTPDVNKQPSRIITASGGIVYDDNLVKLSGNKAVSDLNNYDTEIEQSQYQLVGRQGRGNADKIILRNQRYIVMNNGSFTSCPVGDDSWSVSGSEIIQDNDEQLAEIWNARFNIGSVPVFYSPYLQIPTGDKRRSGFLLPITSYSNNNGIQFATPYYWNIAPNFDATLTPNVISYRGIQFQNEFRYLLMPGAGLFQIDWLPSDRRAPDLNKRDRWLFHWHHNGVFQRYWRFNTDYNKVSDNRYLNDLTTPYGQSTDGYISQKYGIGYADKYWDSSLRVKQFQVFTTGGNSNAYRAMPQIDITNYQYHIGPFNLQTYSQFAHFTSENPHNPKVNRFHLEPALSLPIYEDWGTFSTEVKMLATHFRQDVPEGFAADYRSRTGSSAPELDNTISRIIPQYKINGKLVFDRDVDFLKDYTQTLEPQVQYLYVPYKNQSNIYIYDSTLLQADYTGLFRDRIYGGLDRIASANQLTSGVTSRFYDEKLSERFNFSVGQIYYFDASRTGDEEFAVDKDTGTGSLVWAADTYWKISEQFITRGGIQYDDRLDSISLGDAVIEYRYSDNQLLQLNYRYASKEYISATVRGIDQSRAVYQQDISQVGAVTSYPINDRWAGVAAYYYDPKLKQTNNSLVGLQYANCCWGVNVAFERKIVDWNKKGNLNSDYENKISFNIELRGLSGSQRLSTAKMLRTNILPYQRTF